MSDMKHTPGPWRFNCDDHPDVLDTNGNPVAWPSTLNRSIETANANARLIAAAPEMLELLLELRGLWGADADLWPCYEKAETLLKKLEGE